MSAGDEFDLFWSLKKFAEYESDSERAKQELALRYDFNLFDAFRVVDAGSNGFIYRFEMEDNLKRRGVYADRSQIEALYRRWDRNQDGKLTFSEFADVIQPLDRSAADALNRRNSNYRDPRPFSPMTTDLFESTLRKILRNLGDQASLNRQNYYKPSFSISAAFERIDADGNGFITASEVSNFCSINWLFSSAVSSTITATSQRTESSTSLSMRLIKTRMAESRMVSSSMASGLDVHEDQERIYFPEYFQIIIIFTFSAI